MNEKTNILATELFNKLGIPSKIGKNGPADVLRELNKLGIKPSDQKAAGRGISFYVSKEDADKILENATKSKDPDVNDKIRRDIRSLSRAILDLYEMLGEEPHAKNSIHRLAER